MHHQCGRWLVVGGSIVGMLMMMGKREKMMKGSKEDEGLRNGGDGIRAREGRWWWVVWRAKGSSNYGGVMASSFLSWEKRWQAVERAATSGGSSGIEMGSMVGLRGKKAVANWISRGEARWHQMDRGWWQLGRIARGIAREPHDGQWWLGKDDGSGKEALSRAGRSDVRISATSWASDGRCGRAGNSMWMNK